MKRFTIRRAMVLVAVVAVNIGVARMLYGYDDETAAGLVPIGLLIQLGAYRAIRGKGRAFWVGFVASAAAVVSTYVLAVPGSSSPFYPWWGEYFRLAVRACGPLGRALMDSARAGNQPVFMLTLSAIVMPAPLVIGLVGGVISWGFARLVHHKGPSPPATPGSP